MKTKSKSLLNVPSLTIWTAASVGAFGLRDFVTPIFPQKSNGALTFNILGNPAEKWLVELLSFSSTLSSSRNAAAEMERTEKVTNGGNVTLLEGFVPPNRKQLCVSICKKCAPSYVISFLIEFIFRQCRYFVCNAASDPMRYQPFFFNSGLGSNHRENTRQKLMRKKLRTVGTSKIKEVIKSHTFRMETSTAFELYRALYVSIQLHSRILHP